MGGGVDQGEAHVSPVALSVNPPMITGSLEAEGDQVFKHNRGQIARRDLGLIAGNQAPKSLRPQIRILHITSRHGIVESLDLRLEKSSVLAHRNKIAHGEGIE